MGRCRRVSDEALRIAEIVRNVDQAQRIEKAETRFLAARDIERNDAAAQLHLPAGEFVLRMTGQSGVNHALDFRMVLEVARDCSGGSALAVDAQLEGFETLQQQPC